MKKNEILKAFNLFVKGDVYAGMVDQITTPKLTIKTEEVRTGGMDAAVDMDVGMEKLMLEYSLAGYAPDLLKSFGVITGERVDHTLKGATEDRDGTIKSETIQAAGKIIEIDEGEWKPGSTAQTKVKISLTYYKRSQDGNVLVEIDVENGVRSIDGVDQLEKVRNAIGL